MRELQAQLRSVNLPASEQWSVSNPVLHIVGNRKDLQMSCSPGIDDLIDQMSIHYRENRELDVVQYRL